MTISYEGADVPCGSPTRPASPSTRRWPSPPPARAALGIDAFTAAADTPPAGPLRRLLTPLLQPLLNRLLRAVGTRARA